MGVGRQKWDYGHNLMIAVTGARGWEAGELSFSLSSAGSAMRPQEGFSNSVPWFPSA